MVIILTVGPAGPSQRTRQMLLESEGLEVRHATPQNALASLHQSTFDMVLLDFKVSQQTENELRAALPESTKVIRLDQFTHPQVLLDLVKGKVVRIDDRRP